MTDLTHFDDRALTPAALQLHIDALLDEASIGAGVRSMTARSQGANNRIHRIETSSGVYAVKQYFRHPGDQRDRLAAESAFAEYANAAAPGATPRYFGKDEEAGLALFEFVDGRRPAPDEVNEPLIDAASDFFNALNTSSRRLSALLPLAAESSFTIAGHLSLIGKRVAQLGELDLAPNDPAAGLIGRLQDAWDRAASIISLTARREGREHDVATRCISPSDFGFHNALLTADGAVRFVDFEYAGWDDPAKMVGDFFAQPALPVAPEYFDRFTGRCLRSLPDSAAALQRSILLRPAYVVKWCCIALNVFIPVHLARRRFANPSLDEAALKRVQIGVAERLLLQLASSQ